MSGFNSEIGGSIKAYETNLTVHSSYFSDNTATSGGAIAFLCSLNRHCLFEAGNNTFSSNSASLRGGAIYFNWLPPVISSQNFYSNNTAPYGQDLASYPYDLVVTREDNEVAASGQPFKDSFRVALLDIYGKEVAIDNSSITEI